VKDLRIIDGGRSTTLAARVNRAAAEVPSPRVEGRIFVERIDRDCFCITRVAEGRVSSELFTFNEFSAIVGQGSAILAGYG
jgi:hypothetical protein